MELRHFRYFVAIAEQASFTKAAARLRVSQPTLSQQIRDLERELGTLLLCREPGGIRLTPAGEVFYEQIRHVLAGVDHAARAARRAAHDPTTLRVGLDLPLPEDIHIPVMSAFTEAYPHIRVVWRELQMTECDRPLVNGELDVALMWIPVDLERLIWEPLIDQPRGLAVPAGHPMWDVDLVTLADVIDEPLPRVGNAVPVRMRRWWQMYAQRNDEPPQFVGEPASTSREVLLSVKMHQVVCPGPYAYTPPPGIRIVELTGLSRSGTVAARRRDDRRDLPAAFCAFASDIARQMTAH